MNSPNFFILGAARYGTTSLYRYMQRHPDVFMSSPKEPKFFEAEWDRGADYYWRRYFSGWGGEPVVGEARPANLFLPYVPERVHRLAPDAKLVVILRDPVQRAYSQWRLARLDGLDPAGFAEAIEDNLASLRRFRLHQKLRPVLRGRVRQGVLSVTHNDVFLDWSRSQAYGVEFFYPLVGVEINLEGRQQRGIVKRGEYEELRDRIVSSLQALVDPATGRAACRRVCKREEMFHGPYLERIPDIVAVLDDDYDGKVQLAGEVFSDNTLQWEYPFMGYHSREAFFVARGPGIASGNELGETGMIDLAPTLLRLLEVPIPDSMEGKPLAIL